MFHLRNSAITRQYIVIVTANLSVLCLSLNIAWPTSVLLKLQNETQTILLRPVTDEEGSWIVSLASLSGLTLTFTMGYLMDRIGRRTCLVLGYVPRLIMYFMLLYAKEIWVVFLSRVLGGIADVFVMSVVPTYTSEIASKDTRGALGTISQLTSSAGMMILYGLGPFISYSELNLSLTCIVIVITVLTWFLPETPYYLYSKGEKEQCMKNLIYLRHSENVAYEETKQYCVNQTNLTKAEIFKDKIIVKTLMKVIFLSILLQLVGYNAICMYMMEIFRLSKTTVKGEISSLVIGCIQLAACFCTLLIAEKVGRKTILITSFIGMAVGMVGLGAFFQLKQAEYEISGFLNFMPLLSMILVIFCFNAGPGSIFWTVVAELFDSPARATGVSIGMGTTIIFIFLTTKNFVYCIKTAGPTFIYGFFGINCIIFIVFIVCFIPETKGKSFGEIQMELGRREKLNM